MSNKTESVLVNQTSCALLNPDGEIISDGVLQFVHDHEGYKILWVMESKDDVIYAHFHYDHFFDAVNFYEKQLKIMEKEGWLLN